MSTIVVSIVTVVYNDQKHIEATLKSCFNQDYINKEIIVIDGGSDDGTLDIIKKYDSLITNWISEKDSGIYDAMNKGVKASRGDYICFMNSGDTFFNDKTLTKVFEDLGNDQFDFIYGDCIIKYPDNLRRIALSKPIEQVDKGMVCSHQSLLTRKAMFEKRCFRLDLSITSDFELLYQSYLDGAIFKQVNYPLSIISSEGLSDIKRIQCYSEYYSIVKGHINLKVKMIYLSKILKSFVTIIIKKCIPNIFIRKVLKYKYRKTRA